MQSLKVSPSHLWGDSVPEYLVGRIFQEAEKFTRRAAEGEIRFLFFVGGLPPHGVRRPRRLHAATG